MEGPAEGSSFATHAASWYANCRPRKVYSWSFTVTSTLTLRAPSPPAPGVTHTTSPSVTLRASTTSPPKEHFTWSEATKLWPVMDTTVPPCSGPTSGSSCSGCTAVWNSNSVPNSAEGYSRPFQVMTTDTVPGAWAGLVHSTCDSPTTVATTASSSPNRQLMREACGRPGSSVGSGEW